MTKSRAASAAFMAALALAAAPASAQDHGAAAAPAAPPTAAAAARAQTPLGAAFDAAERGELGPLRQLAAGARGDLALLVRNRLALARFEALADLPALGRIAAGRDPALREAALSLLSDDAFLRGAYADAARWGRAFGEAQAARGDAQAAARTAQQAQVAALLAGRPPQRLEGSIAERSIPARTDRVGLPRLDIAVNGQAQEAVFDTGASLSVLSAETARRLGVAIIDGGASVGNGVEGNVAVRLGVVDRLEVAGAVLRDVPFLIIDDSQLTFPVPGGYDIRAILGLPVMRALGRMRMEPEAGRFTLLPAAAAPARAAKLIATGGQVYVEVAVDGREVPLHLDTGANQSGLSARYAAANPERVAALATGQARMASAGGTASTRFANWPNAPLALGGRVLLLPSLRIALAAPGAPEPRDSGTLGSEALRAFESYTLDFRAMRLELGPPVPPAPATVAH